MFVLYETDPLSRINIRGIYASKEDAMIIMQMVEEHLDPICDIAIVDSVEEFNKVLEKSYENFIR